MSAPDVFEVDPIGPGGCGLVEIDGNLESFRDLPRGMGCDGDALLDRDAADGNEWNHVRGADPRMLGEVVGEVRGRTGKPLIVKLTPNTADVPACAQAAEQGGADAVSLINSLRAMALSPLGAARPHRSWLGGGTGGLSGPAVRTIALAQVIGDAVVGVIL